MEKRLWRAGRGFNRVEKGYGQQEEEITESGKMAMDIRFRRRQRKKAMDSSQTRQ